MSNRGGSPSPSRHWYDVRPTPLSIETTFDSDAFVDLGNGDYRGSLYGTSSPSHVSLGVNSGTISLTAVPLEDSVQSAIGSARVFTIDVDYLQSHPHAFETAGGNVVPSDALECSFGYGVVSLSLRSLPKCAIVVAWEGQFIGRLLFGDEEDVAALSALPLVFGSQAGELLPSAPSIDNSRAYLDLNPSVYSSFKVFGFNLMPAEDAPLFLRPSVKGGAAGGGVACPVVGGLYGMEVSVPEVGFNELWFYDGYWWLRVSEV